MQHGVMQHCCESWTPKPGLQHLCSNILQAADSAQHIEHHRRSKLCVRADPALYDFGCVAPYIPQNTPVL
jgi:hypothetical protein